MPRTEKYMLEIAVLLDVQEEWQVSMSEETDPLYSFARTPQVAYRRVDGFETRTEFLSVRSPADALRFFRVYGPFQILADPKTQSRKGPDAKAESIRWSQFQRAQQDLGDALLKDTVPEWLYQFVFQRPLQIDLWFQAIRADDSKRVRAAIGKEDAAITLCDDVVQALRATIFLTRMTGFKWKHCARRGCPQIFEQTHKRKIYCDESCAHLEAVKAHNARMKEKKSDTKMIRRPSKKKGRTR